MHQGRGQTVADLCRNTQCQSYPAGLAPQCAWRSALLLSDVTSEDWKIAQLSGNLPLAAYDGTRVFPNFQLSTAVTVTRPACTQDRTRLVARLLEQGLAQFWQIPVFFYPLFLGDD